MSILVSSQVGNYAKRVESNAWPESSLKAHCNFRNFLLV